MHDQSSEAMAFDQAQGVNDSSLGSNHIKGVCVWLYMGFGKIEHE
jgi:hypothetical protein